jgi:hypothetical protein
MTIVSGFIVPKMTPTNHFETLDNQNQLSHLPTSVTTTASNMKNK